MLILKEKYVNSTQVISKYEDCGYEATLTSFKNPLDGSDYMSIEVKCKYEKMHPYPVISFNRFNKTFQATFNSFFVLTADNQAEWIAGIKNATQFITEMNELVSSLEKEKLDVEVER